MNLVFGKWYQRRFSVAFLNSAIWLMLKNEDYPFFGSTTSLL